MAWPKASDVTNPREGELVVAEYSPNGELTGQMNVLEIYGCGQARTVGL
jgi:hypothetical protein